MSGHHIHKHTSTTRTRRHAQSTCATYYYIIHIILLYFTAASLCDPCQRPSYTIIIVRSMSKRIHDWAVYWYDRQRENQKISKTLKNFKNFWKNIGLRLVSWERGLVLGSNVRSETCFRQALVHPGLTWGRLGSAWEPEPAEAPRPSRRFDQFRWLIIGLSMWGLVENRE